MPLWQGTLSQSLQLVSPERMWRTWFCCIAILYLFNVFISCFSFCCVDLLPLAMPRACITRASEACPASATSSTNGLGAFSDPYSQGLGDLLHHQASGLVEGVFCVCPAMPEQAKARRLPHTICTWACCTPEMEGRQMRPTIFIQRATSI